MRISDWSSDVCSSDLLDPLVAFCAAAIVRANRDVRDLGLSVDLTDPSDDLEFGKIDHATSSLRQIGRASCRARVCQYGVDLGGRSIIKKKKTKIDNIRQQHRNSRETEDNAK